MKKIIFILLAVCSMAVHAAAPISGGWMYNGGSPAADRDAVALAACKSKFSSAVTASNPAPNGPNFTYSCYSAAPSFIGTSPVIYLASYCQYGGVPNTSLPLAQQCPDPPVTCTPGRQFDAWVEQGTVIPGTSKTTDMGPPSNMGGCRVYGSEVYECLIGPGDQVFCKWKLTEGGEAPSGETPDSAATPPVDAKPTDVPQHNPAQGQGCPKGTVNLGTDSTGGSICGGSGSSPSAAPKNEVTKPPVTTNNPDGSTSVANVTERTNSDGSVTTTTVTTTTAADGTVTKHTATSTGNKPGGTGGTGGGGGGQGKDDSSDEKTDDFCVKNPNLNICKNSEVSGACDSVTCTGDAIQCAIYRSQQKAYCELNKENPSATLGNAAVAGNDPLKSTLPTKENALQINMQSLDQNGFLGGGACFKDKVLAVRGHSIVLPFSILCPYLEWLRYVVMLIAALISFRIVSKPVLGD